MSDHENGPSMVCSLCLKYNEATERMVWTSSENNGRASATFKKGCSYKMVVIRHGVICNSNSNSNSSDYFFYSNSNSNRRS